MPFLGRFLNQSQNWASKSQQDSNQRPASHINRIKEFAQCISAKNRCAPTKTQMLLSAGDEPPSDLRAQIDRELQRLELLLPGWSGTHTDEARDPAAPASSAILLDIKASDRNCWRAVVGRRCATFISLHPIPIGNTQRAEGSLARHLRKLNSYSNSRARPAPFPISCDLLLRSITSATLKVYFPCREIRRASMLGKMKNGSEILSVEPLCTT